MANAASSGRSRGGRWRCFLRPVVNLQQQLEVPSLTAPAERYQAPTPSPRRLNSAQLRPTNRRPHAIAQQAWRTHPWLIALQLSRAHGPPSPTGSIHPAARPPTSHALCRPSRIGLPLAPWLWCAHCCCCAEPAARRRTATGPDGSGMLRTCAVCSSHHSHHHHYHHYHHSRRPERRLASFACQPWTAPSESSESRPESLETSRPSLRPFVGTAHLISNTTTTRARMPPASRLRRLQLNDAGSPSRCLHHVSPRLAGTPALRLPCLQ